MDIPSLSEATLRTHSSAASYSRGRSYYERGAVIDTVVRGNLLEGAVEGSQYTPYHVQVGFDAGGVSTATCTCPYDYGGWCKHIIALLLAAPRARGLPRGRPTNGLAGLPRRDQDQARAQV
jgi:uncharacterized Zn finger protein